MTAADQPQSLSMIKTLAAEFLIADPGWSVARPIPCRLAP